MKRIKKWKLGLLLVVLACVYSGGNVYADDIGDTGGTGQGNIGGTNVYTFNYIYDAGADAIELQVNTTKAVKGFGNSTSHTFNSPSDQTVLNTSNPRLGSSLDSAIQSMISIGGYNLDVATVKQKLGNLGYYDNGNGIWKYSGGYLTYVSAVKIRPQKHTVHYDANGGSGAPSDQTKKQGETLTLRSGKPTRTGYTFKYWVASIGGHYSPGESYTHDQDGGTVTMKAHWADETKPSLSINATPNSWSAGNGTVTVTSRDQGSGLAEIKLERYSKVTKTWTTVKTWSYSGTTDSVTKTYTEKDEGVFYYKVTSTDKAGNSNSASSDYIYLDHSNPVINGVQNTVTSWTKVAPTISVTATDYLSGTTYKGSWLASLVIKNSSGSIVASGTTSASYTLADSYQGTYTWTIVATDNVGHVTTKTVTTHFDKTGPACSSFYAIPNYWSAGYGTIYFNVSDGWSGLASVVIERYSYVTGTWSTVKTYSYSNVTYAVSDTLTEYSEGVFYYKLTAKDRIGNTTTNTTAAIYLDHSSPVIYGVSNTVTSWTNRAPVINVSATDYLSGTTYNGSGLRSLTIYDDSGRSVASGTTATSYTLAAKYEGVHTWTIKAIDNVGHVTTQSVTTRYDCTLPGIDGTEITHTYNGLTYSGYCQDNIINQYTDDEARRSSNNPNQTSGLKSIIVYKVVNGQKTAIYTDTTWYNFAVSDTHSNFSIYYDDNNVEEYIDYYLVVVSDYAGNISTKKLTTQRSLLTRFHTSIDRSSYEN